jgi:hypothetical protein
MNENARTLARQIAYAITEVLPTGDFSRKLGMTVTRVLGHGDADATETMAGLLAEAKAEIEQATPEQRKTAKSTVYKNLADLVENLIAAGLVSYDQAEELASALRQASAGVGGSSYSGRPQKAFDPPNRDYRAPGSPIAEDARRPRRNRPPGPPVGGPDDDDE